MQMSKRVKGSISVLLTMILLPMMTYATMIIDASRLQLVRNNIAGAGDLTLNAIMSEYNVMLEEMYGLFANTTSEEELKDVLSAYFQQTIEGRFLPQLENENEMIQNTIDMTLTKIMDPNGYTREDVTDFLALQLQDFTAGPVVGSALANPATMKRQIIEYMKYRGPVSIANTILGKLDFLADSGNQVDSCDQKVQYAQTLSGLHDPCIDAYTAIIDQYNNGAMLLNEALGLGLVSKKFENAENKSHSNRLTTIVPDPKKEYVADIYTDAKLEYQYATAFALMNAMSPFASNNPNINQSIHIDGVDYPVCNGKSNSHEHHNYDSYLEEEQKNFNLDNSKYLSQNNVTVNVEEYDSKLDMSDLRTTDWTGKYKELDDNQINKLNSQMQDNINKLNALIAVAGYECGYDNGNSRLVMQSGNLSVNIGYLDTNSKQRSAGQFDLYQKPTFSIADGIKTEKKDNVTYHYPNYKRMLLSGKENSDNYYYNIKSFIDTNNTDNDKIKNNELKKEDVAYQFETQYENSMKVLEAQQELVGPLKNGIQYVAKHQAKFGEIQERYNEIWNQLKSQLTERYVSDYNKKYKENWEELENLRNEWIKDLMENATWENLIQTEKGEDEDGDEVEISIWKSGVLPAWAPAYTWVYDRLSNDQYEKYKGRVEDLIYAAENETNLRDFTDLKSELQTIVDALDEIKRYNKKYWENEKGDKLDKDDLIEAKEELEWYIKSFILDRIANIMSAVGEPGEDYLDSAAELTPDEEKTLWKDVLDNCHIAVDANNQMKYYDEKHERPIYDGMDQINKLEKTNMAMTEIQSFFNGGQSGYSSYKDLINEYITRLKNHNQDYFGRFEDIHIKLGSSAYMGVALTLREMKKGLETAETELNEIYTLIENQIEPKQKDWKDSIDSIDSDSTRAAMTSDYESMISRINKDEVDKLRKLVGTLKTKVQKWIDAIDSCSYLGEKLVMVGSVSGSNGVTMQLKDNTIFLDLVKDKMKYHFNCDIEIKVDDTDTIIQTARNTIISKAENENPSISIPRYKDAQDVQKLKGLLKTHEYLDKNGNLKKDKGIDKIAEEWFNENILDDANKFHISKEFEMDANKTKAARYQVLDGIKDLFDDKDLEGAVTGTDKENAGVEDAYAKYQLKSDGIGKLIDPQEAFMVTLYSENKAAKAAESADEGEKQTANDAADNIDNLANQKMDSTDDPPEEEEPESDPVEANFAEILSEIQSYYMPDPKDEDDAEGALDGDPELSTGSIDKDDPSKSSGGNGLNQAKKIMNKFASIGENIGNTVYLEEYFTEMFTCRTDNQRLNSLTKDADKNALPVILLNGYGNEASGSPKQLNTNTEWYGKEVEYLLWGKSEPNENLACTDATIFAIRFALNAIYAFTAPEIIQFVNSVATAIAGWTVIGVPIVAAVLTIGIALAESGYDLALLHDGVDVPIYKNKSTFVCSPLNALKELTGIVTDKLIDTVVDKVSDTIEKKLDEAIDGLADNAAELANKKISECTDKLTGFVDDFGDTQLEAVRAAIRNQFFAPIQNQLIQICSLVDIGSQYEQLDIKPIIENSLYNVFNDISAKFLDPDKLELDPDSVVYKVCAELLTEENRQAIIDKIMYDETNGLMVQINKCWDFLKQNDPVASQADALTAYLQAPINTAMSGVTSIEEVVNGVIDEFVDTIDGIKKELNDSIEGVKNSITNQLEAHAEDAASTLKTLIHEEMDVATKQLTGFTKSARDAASKEAAKTKKEFGKQDTGMASGVTLNYKEYCKILMLIMTACNEKNILQRAGVLITSNMRYPTPDCEEQPFDLTSANTLFSVNANVNMMTLFPWPVKDVIDEANPDSGLQLDLSRIRTDKATISYCGVNGY